MSEVEWLLMNDYKLNKFGFWQKGESSDETIVTSWEF